jgi:flagellar protein FlaG
MIMNIQPIGTPVAQSTQFASHAAGTVDAPFLPAASGAAVQSEPAPAQLAQAVASINETLRALTPGLEFSVDQDSHRTVVRIVDQQTKELIRQMPSAETLEIAKALDRVQGLLISLRA